MGTTNDTTSLNDVFKRIIAPKLKDLIPSNTTLLKMLPSIKESDKIGRNYLEPVALSYENGVTYGDGTAFTLINPSAGVYDEMEVTSAPVVLRSQVSQAAANRMAQSQKTFVDWATLRTVNMKRSMSSRAEAEMWYGQSGLGVVESVTGTSSTTLVAQISAATWAPGIWSGKEGAAIEVYNGASAVAGNAVAGNSLVITKIDYENRKITAVGNATEIGNVAATHDLFFQGSKANGMIGIYKQLTNTGTIFGIDAATYGLFKANTYDASGSFTIAKALKAVAPAVGKGGLDENVKCFVSNLTYENMNSDMAALRALDSSFSGKKGENGVENIVYHCQSGLIEIVPSAYVKQGHAFIMPMSSVRRIGAQDITFETNGPNTSEFFLPLAGTAGYEIRCQYDFSILNDSPAKSVMITGIVNS